MVIHYDELWKNIIEKLFPQFLLYFMPELSADADLTLGYEFLDKELQKIKRIWRGNNPKPVVFPLRYPASSAVKKGFQAFDRRGHRGTQR